MHAVDHVSLPQFIDALSDATVILDHNGTILAANTAWQNLASNGGDGPPDHVGHDYNDVCMTNDISGANATIVPDKLQETLETGAPFRCEYPRNLSDAVQWYELTATRLTVDDQPHLIVQHRNISTRHMATADTADAALQAEMLAALVATSTDAVLSYDLDGRIVTWNRAAQRLYGYSAEEAIGQSLEILYPRDWPKRITQYRDEIIAGVLTSFEAVRKAKSGEHRNVWITGAPIRDSAGDIVAVSNIHRDITEVRRLEEARELIAHEVIHRANNMLSIVLAVQQQSAKTATSLSDFNRKFGERLQSLTASTDLLVSGNWTTVALDTLVHTQLAPFTDNLVGAIKVDGPPVVLQPTAVQAIGMALHELATNAAKYGASSATTGTVDIRWQLVGDGEDTTLDFSWNETGVNCDSLDSTSGFGRTVLEKFSPTSLNAPVEYRIGPEGVIWRVQIDGEHFQRPG